jgi:hypothetical protein
MANDQASQQAQKLHRRRRALRFRNEWYWLYTAEVLGLSGVHHRGAEITDVYLGAVIEQGKAYYLYR